MVPCSALLEEKSGIDFELSDPCILPSVTFAQELLADIENRSADFYNCPGRLFGGQKEFLKVNFFSVTQFPSCDGRRTGSW